MVKVFKINLKGIYSFIEAKTNELNGNVPVNKKRTRCEVYSRVVGYMRPVSQWNTGKQIEFRDRKYYEI